MSSTIDSMGCIGFLDRCAFVLNRTCLALQRSASRSHLQDRRPSNTRSAGHKHPRSPHDSVCKAQWTDGPLGAPPHTATTDLDSVGLPLAVTLATGVCVLVSGRAGRCVDLEWVHFSAFCEGNQAEKNPRSRLFAISV
eukprot:2456578-Rhodomonas_salina.1